jgi:hypothetical protein
MISSHAREFVASNLELNPREGSFVNVETPDIVYWFSASVTSEHKQIGFAEDD